MERLFQKPMNAVQSRNDFGKKSVWKEKKNNLELAQVRMREALKLTRPSEARKKTDCTVTGPQLVGGPLAEQTDMLATFLFTNDHYFDLS